MCPLFEILFFTVRKSHKRRLSQWTSGLTKQVVNFTDSEMFLLYLLYLILNTL